MENTNFVFTRGSTKRFTNGFALTIHTTSDVGVTAEGIKERNADSIGAVRVFDLDKPKDAQACGDFFASLYTVIFFDDTLPPMFCEEAAFPSLVEDAKRHQYMFRVLKEGKSIGQKKFLQLAGMSDLAKEREKEHKRQQKERGLA